LPPPLGEKYGRDATLTIFHTVSARHWCENRLGSSSFP
jgi:hypothetical protein